VSADKMRSMCDERSPFEPKNIGETELKELGNKLDEWPALLGGRSWLMGLAGALLNVRTRSGAVTLLKPNSVQLAFERARGQRNIVLKARQLGLTTWAAARFFIKTITRPGTLTLQVAHTQDSAEEIFRIVHRFLDNLPDHLRRDVLKTSHANLRQIVFPRLDSEYRVVSAGERNAGRGLTVQNLHCSELARWPGDPADILAGLRASLARTSQIHLKFLRMLDEPRRDLYDFHFRSRQSSCQCELRRQILVGQHARVLWIVLEFHYVSVLIGTQHQLALCAAPHPADVLHCFHCQLSVPPALICSDCIRALADGRGCQPAPDDPI
jgi:hypothetical protein